MGVAVVLDPKYKIELLEYYYVKLYGNDANDQVKSIRQLCYDLFYEYQLKMNNGSSSDSQMLDLDVYLEEKVLPRSPDFDILLWWKLNGVKYPTFQTIANDVLAIHVSTVASESTFSTGGHILSLHRSRLHWTTLEALMCARSWLWSAEKTGDSNSKVDNENAILFNEIESDDEGELLISGVTLLSNSRLENEDDHYKMLI
ncbi:zinc finger BED domain-containing protein DAYSLEEPER-like [Cicer arietinum]|uniref:zinc finger BED domain-containing protein DAYSLEEPER-like n=1 Tax=Cicer arietinum TaxID=3827 RepID=UPI003CC543CF